MDNLWTIYAGKICGVICPHVGFECPGQFAIFVDNNKNMAINFVFLILPEIHLMDLAGPDQVFLESIGYGADFEIRYCSLRKGPVTSAGLPFGEVPSYTAEKLNPGDFLFVPGANVSYLLSDDFKKETALFEWLNKMYNAGVNICSICSGAFALAQSGLLDGVPCTTHFKRTAQLQKCFPHARVTENTLFTEHNGIYTSAGIASGIDMALHIVEKLKGSYFAHKVARELVVYNRRKGDQSQYSAVMEFRNHIHSGIHKAQDWIHENLDSKFTLIDLAETANMSDRNFTRIFKKETGVTVSDYIRMLRKERINELLKNPDITRIEIARKCGLKSERHLRRIMKHA